MHASMVYIVSTILKNLCNFIIHCAHRPDRRQTTPQVAPLAARQAASHLQDGDDDVQGHDVIDACIPG